MEIKKIGKALRELNEQEALNINLFAGPGVGKSQTSAGVFHELKKRGYNADVTQEFAKELVYAKDWTRLADQLLVAGEQHHRMFRMLYDVDFAIHDSPFVMGITYCCETKIAIPEFLEFLTTQFNRYDNYNILLTRNRELEYKQDGRMQDLEGAIQKDNEVRELLDRNNIKYVEVKIDDLTINTICDLIIKD